MERSDSTSRSGPTAAVHDARPPRNQAIESLRVVAAFGIVAFHAKVAGAQAFYAGLVVFLFLAPMFEAGPNWLRKRGTGELARTLLLPYAFWYLFYLAANFFVGKPLFVDWVFISVLAAGPSLGIFGS